MDGSVVWQTSSLAQTTLYATAAELAPRAACSS
jgi:hypothetical protein